MIGNEILSFDLKNTPSFLKRSDGFLDPNVIENITLILYYQGTIDWSK